jgi:serine O-acetyltransferase
MRHRHSSTTFTQLFAHADEVEGNQKDLADLLTNLLPDEAELTLDPPQGEESGESATSRKSSYDLGLGINLPVSDDGKILEDDVDDKLHWYAPEPVIKTPPLTAEQPIPNRSGQGRTIRKMVARRQEDQVLRGALWHEEHYEKDPEANNPQNKDGANINGNTVEDDDDEGDIGFPRPDLFYPDIDLSIPESIYSETKDVVWDLMRWEAYQEAQREPLLVSFFYSSILNHDTLESSLSFLLANKLASPAMISTQVQSLVAEALRNDPSVGRAIRADIMAVRDRDPACTCLPDVFLYFKGFQALQTYRVAHILWEKKKKKVLAHYLQSQMSQSFQIDIHPNATLGSGIMLDHGTGIVIGETARIGHNCSILHHVTLGGSGKKGVDRHPKVGEGVLLGAGASILGNVKIGDGCQVGAGTLVITDLPAHSVAVGVPAKIIGSFKDVTEQPSKVMNQMMDTGFTKAFQSEGI